VSSQGYVEGHRGLFLALSSKPTGSLMFRRLCDTPSLPSTGRHEPDVEPLFALLEPMRTMGIIDRIRLFARVPGANTLRSAHARNEVADLRNVAGCPCLKLLHAVRFGVVCYFETLGSVIYR
jgi:hypothetical protein